MPSVVAVIAVQVIGILTIESFHRGSWRRIIFLAEAVPVPVPVAVPRKTGAPDLTGGADTAASSGHAAAAALGCTQAPQAAERRSYPCKTLPDVESAGACWVTAEELLKGDVPLRSASEMAWIPEVAAGRCKVWPLEPSAVPDLALVFPDYPL